MSKEKNDREIFPNPKGKSPVWRHFGFFKDGNGEVDRSKTICKHCYAQYKTQSGTSNLLYHLQSEHKDITLTKSSSTSSQPTLFQTIAKSSCYGSTSEKSTGSSDF